MFFLVLLENFPLSSTKVLFTVAESHPKLLPSAFA